MTVKQYLLPKDGNFYKANLHAHSTVSDGRYTPEQIKELYRAKGYHIVAFSDHNTLVPHSELKSEAFLPLTATEIDLHIPVSKFTDTCHGSHIPLYHINLFSKDENRTALPSYVCDYGVSYAQDLITAALDGFLVQLNHPRWSYQTAKDYFPLEHLWSLEVYNHTSEQTMLDGWGDYEYESLCRAFYNDGKSLPVATAGDDNHNVYLTDDPRSDSFGGWTMIKAQSLDYKSIITAMENKDLYATTGPEITELYLDTQNNVHVKCSPAHAVALLTDNREYARVLSFDDDITEAVLPLSEKVPPNWFRIEVISTMRNRQCKALTRAYQMNELL